MGGKERESEMIEINDHMIYSKALKTADYIQIQNFGALNEMGKIVGMKERHRIGIGIHLFHLCFLFQRGNQITFLVSHCSHWVASKLLLIPGSSSPWKYQYAEHSRLLNRAPYIEVYCRGHMYAYNTI